MKNTLSALMVLCAVLSINAQSTALKTNLISDAGGHVNLGLEKTLTRLGPLWSLDLTGDYRSWDGRSRARRHLLGMAELRHWQCDPLLGSFLSVHVLAGTFNYGDIDCDLHFPGTDLRELRDRRFQGWSCGLGLGAGHDWAIDRHWNIEAQVALGWVHSWYDRFNCLGCGRMTDHLLEHNYWGPTKLSLSIVYLP